MSGSLKGKVGIVTGGTGALGRNVVTKLAEDGLKVYVPTVTLEEFNVVFDRSQDNDEDTFTLKKIFAFVCDATNEDSVTEFVNSVASIEDGKIDFLVNTVGGIHGNIHIENFSTKEFERSFNLNFLSTFYFSREVLRVMLKNKYGRIVSVGAIAALETTPGKFAYSVSKQAVINLMNTISAENKDNNIRANTIVPSIIDTPANREWGSDEEIKKWVNPEDVAEIISDLFKPGFSPIRESVIKIYGNY